MQHSHQLGTACLTLSFLLTCVPDSVSAQNEPVSAQKTALDDYIAEPDPAFRWSVARRMEHADFVTTVVDLKSQSWLTTDVVNRTIWQHWLIVVRPRQVKHDTALLLISGGSNDDQAPSRTPEELRQIALATGSVVAELKMVPNQPLVFRDDGKKRYEDDLIAYAWTQFAETGNCRWLPRFAMVKSAVRAMDALQAYFAEQDDVSIERFVVAGASKRGWTTWLTGVVDDRVAAIIPIVIDVLNVEQSMRHHFAAYGFWAQAIDDYEQHELTKRIGSPEMQKIYALVDPIRYRQRLTMPKYIVNASGDEYFLPDSSQFYFDQLPGEKLLRYVPNADHSLDGSDALQTITAFYHSILTGQERPRFRWQNQQDGRLTVEAVDAPRRVTLWQASNPNARDFRVETLGKRYQPTRLESNGDGEYSVQIAEPDSGWTAYFVELEYEGVNGLPLKFTTDVHVIPDELPHAGKLDNAAVGAQ